MIDLITRNASGISAICRRHGVRALWVFGSAATGSWNPASSDVDILMDLGAHDDRYAKRLMRSIVELEALLGAKVDITTTEQVRSDWFRRELDATKDLVFEAEPASVAG